MIAEEGGMIFPTKGMPSVSFTAGSVNTGRLMTEIIQEVNETMIENTNADLHDVDKAEAIPVLRHGDNNGSMTVISLKAMAYAANYDVTAHEQGHEQVTFCIDFVQLYLFCFLLVLQLCPIESKCITS